MNRRDHQIFDPWYPVYLPGWWRILNHVPQTHVQNLLRESEFWITSECFDTLRSRVQSGAPAKGRHVQEPDGSWDLCSGRSSSELSRVSWRWQTSMGNGVFNLQNEELGIASNHIYGFAAFKHWYILWFTVKHRELNSLYFLWMGQWMFWFAMPNYSDITPLWPARSIATGYQYHLSRKHHDIIIYYIYTFYLICNRHWIKQ